MLQRCIETRRVLVFVWKRALSSCFHIFLLVSENKTPMSLKSSRFSYSLTNGINIYKQQWFLYTCIVLKITYKTMSSFTDAWVFLLLHVVVHCTDSYVHGR